MLKSTRRLLASAASVATLFVAPAAFAEQAAAASPTVATVQQAQGQGPAMWVIRDADSTLYLFGSFHLLRPDTAWGQAHVDQAFASADEVWFELTDIDDTAQAGRLIQTLGVSPDRPLSSLLNAEELASLDRAAKAIGATAQALDPLRPWLASMQLVLAQMVLGGFDPNAGVDKVLMTRATALGKPMKGFETMEEQFRLLAGMSEEGQVEMLRETLKELDKGPVEMERLLTAWSTGDVATIDTEMVQEMKAQSPEAYDLMLTRRNVNWANQIKQILAGSGTTFIAVGAAHLVGEDSVQAILAKDGITAERVTQ
jgi:uncharacterized protein